MSAETVDTADRESASASPFCSPYQTIQELVRERTMELLLDPGSSPRDIRLMVSLMQKFEDQEHRARLLVLAREKMEHAAETQTLQGAQKKKDKQKPVPQAYTPEVKAEIDKLRVAMFGPPPEGWTIDGTPADPNAIDPYKELREQLNHQQQQRENQQNQEPQHRAQQEDEKAPQQNPETETKVDDAVHTDPAITIAIDTYPSPESQPAATRTATEEWEALSASRTSYHAEKRAERKMHRLRQQQERENSNQPKHTPD